MWTWCVEVLLSVLGLFSICDGLSFISSQNKDINLLVLTNKGYVQGRSNVTYIGKKYWAFEGIPYAKPPLESLRFKAPVTISPWKGILDGTKEGPTCIETKSNVNFKIIISGSEDCLYINVYTPENPRTSTKLLPVMVWIYGGAFLFGNSSSEFYGADNFLDQNIIVVTFNYRVGFFGFLSTEDLESPGNYGLKDQHFALQWVQKNIKKFGGDKNRITINGQSAGSASVFHHLAFRNSKGLFQGAIASSGSSLSNWAVQRQPRKNAFDLGMAAEIRTNRSAELIEKLRKASLEQLKKASKLLLFVSVPQANREGFPFAPSIEPLHKGAFLTKTTYEIFKKGEFIKVPVIMGTNSLETLFFSEFLLLLKPLNFLYDISPGSLPSMSMNIRTMEERREAGSKIIKKYFPSGSYVDANARQILEYTSDDRFIRPIHKTAQLISKHTPVYFYLFSYVSKYGERSLEKTTSNYRPIPGVAHLEEQFYMWKRRDIDVNPTGLDKLISERLIKMWSNFIKTRNPTPVKDQLLQNFLWPPVTSSNNITYLQIDENFSQKQNYREQHMKFWESLYQTYGQPPYLSY